MNKIDKDNLVEKGIIEEPFDYSFLSEELIERYDFYCQLFEKLYEEKAEQFNINNYYFFLKNSTINSAFARKRKGYSIIGITQAYVKSITDIFEKSNFESILLIALKAEQNTSDAYGILYEIPDFEFNEFMSNCSVQFTFGHEFQHILQLNSAKIDYDLELNENLNQSNFDIKKHAWEFDADRFASFEVLKYIHQIKNEIKINDNKAFKCMLYLGLGSIFLTKLLFYFKVTESTQTISTKPFYTKKFSHPHPIVRILNILEYFKDCVDSLFPNLNIEIQDLLNNSLAILDNYLKSTFPKQSVIKNLFKDLDIYLDDINNYNNELYDVSIKDESIRNLLIKRGIKFED
ncbi:hypothetical protein [Tenacibaculum finnmarkense]|uniref:hypothetical protein n=1 Tax=Tenacibaculum finnmarkense TaxID=2781243 RepID=UPI001E55D18F|nr:hypothetical protein [Tenacibaculum finnmarkense]MCD8445641.1 hypothetical protein [Tenacibaculum finnmarkense genomovar ulcerans]